MAMGHSKTVLHLFSPSCIHTLDCGLRMIVVGWNNGSPNNRTGAGYGVRIVREDRDMYFQNTWSSVIIELDNGDLLVIGC